MIKLNWISFLNSLQISLQFITPLKDHLEPQKSGEILRNQLGKFSFTCAHCDSVRENCKEIMDHINSHFDPLAHHEVSKSPLTIPEVICIDDLELETPMETTITPNAATDDKSCPKMSIVRIIKLKPVKFRPRDGTYVAKKKILSNVA